MAETEQLHTTCCIAGGGPAGMMAGLLLARAGVDVIVLEKHADFFRDFRGDTIHPSTLELMHELGLLEDFLKLPHDEVEQLAGQVGDPQIRHRGTIGGSVAHADPASDLPAVLLAMDGAIELGG